MEIMKKFRLWSRRSDDDRSKLAAGTAYLWDERCETLARVSWDWAWRHFTLALEIDDGGGPELSLTLAPWVFLHAAVRVPAVLVELARRYLLRGVEHQSYEGVDVLTLRQLDGWCFAWSVCHPNGSWTSDTSRWRHGSIDLADVLWGQVEHSAETLKASDVDVPMPEGTYRWRVEMLRRTYSRKRWPGAPRIIYCFDAEPVDGEHIPVPGKGENSWDCGPDGIRGLAGPGRTVDEAVSAIVSAALRSRQRRAGRLRYVDDGKYDEPAQAPAG